MQIIIMKNHGSNIAFFFLGHMLKEKEISTPIGLVFWKSKCQ